jgi:7-cyano-7-deazaguanine reductase
VSLEVFPSPFSQPSLVHVETDEFTCLCPKTGQPDFATIFLDYVPGSVCVELKSLKLYFWSFRDKGAFHEQVTEQIAEELSRALADAHYLRVHMRFKVRGGLHTSTLVERGKRLSIVLDPKF